MVGTPEDRLRHAPLEPADWPALVEVLSACFGITPDRWDSFRRRIGDANLRTARVGGRVVGGLGVYRMGQVFGGRSVGLGGFAGVGVAAEHRGSGVAAAMMGSALAALRDEGVPLAGLYASTQRLYRSVGFEQAGSRVGWRVPLRAVGIADRSVGVERVEDADRVRPLYRPVHGNLDRNDAIWDRILRGQGERILVYRVGDEGYAVLGTEGTGLHYDVLVRDWQAHTPAAARRLWTLLADHSSLGEHARWQGAAVDAMGAHLSEQAATVTGTMRWMIRVLDVPGAFAARGWDHDGEIDLHVEDALFPENAGAWRVRVADGRAEVARGGTGALRCGARGLAPLYTGFYDAPTLRRLGWIDGDDASVRAAARLFAGPEPWMSEMY